jgi:hypothetical protein
MHPFRQAVESGQVDKAMDLFAQNVVFNSPIVYRPYQGREALGVILRAVERVFEDFRYERELVAEEPDGSQAHALVFRARVGDRELQGCDFLHTAPDGLIDELTVMVRPLSGALALAEAMKAEIARVQGEGELKVEASG